MSQHLQAMQGKPQTKKNTNAVTSPSRRVAMNHRGDQLQSPRQPILRDAPRGEKEVSLPSEHCASTLKKEVPLPSVSLLTAHKVSHIGKDKSLVEKELQNDQALDSASRKADVDSEREGEGEDEGEDVDVDNKIEAMNNQVVKLISKLQRAEQQLQRAEQQLQRADEGADEGAAASCSEGSLQELQVSKFAQWCKSTCRDPNLSYYLCGQCNTWANCEVNLQIHLDSKKHARMLRAQGGKGQYWKHSHAFGLSKCRGESWQ